MGAALAALEASRERIDNLNVFPVPDGDTGTNMVATVRATHDALARAETAERAETLQSVVRACLMGARGNSGVILSQLVRGAAEALPSDGAVDAAALARALRGASEAGYSAMRKPQEGTILTVARELAEAAEEESGRAESLEEVLSAVLARGEEALARTPEQLDVLREAGVVDAGGAGLVEILRGIVAHATGEPLPEAPAEAGDLPLEAVHQELSRYRYCTSFFVEGDEADPDRLERELGELGDSLLVVGAPGAVKVHVHTDEPGRALSLATAVGVIEEVDVKNMHVQTAERAERLLGGEVREADPGVVDAVVVAPGAGNAALFRSLGAAAVVEGGQTMNPATADLHAAVDAVRAEEALLLPNNPNVLLAAEQAAAAASKPVAVVPTRTVQAGLAAMVVFDPGRSAEENAAEMEEAAAAVRTGAVTRASRTTVVGDLPVEEGHVLGLVEGEPVVCGPVLADVAREVVARLLAEPADVLTILLGEGVEEADDLRAHIESAHAGLEVEVHAGGQPHYPLLFAAE